MRSYITLFGLAASVHALEPSYSQCTTSSIHHATVLSTKTSTATFTSVPTSINSVSEQRSSNSSSISSTITQAYTLSDFGTATSVDSGTAFTNFSVATSSLSVSQNDGVSQGGASTSHTLGMNEESGSTHSFSSSLSSTTPIGVSQWSTQSLNSPLTTMATTIPTQSSNSSLPKSSLVAFTGSSSRKLSNAGAITVGVLFAIILL